MKIFKKYNTVYHKLLISFVLIVVMTGIISGVSSYTYFSSVFKGEIEEVNTRLLLSIKKEVDKGIVEKVEALSLDLLTDQVKNEEILFFFNNPIEGNQTRIPRLQYYIRNVVSANSDFIDSISIYYEENKILISSESGMNFLKSEIGNVPELHWFEEFNILGKNVMWTNSKHNTSIISHIRAYPYSYTKGKLNTGYVVINLKEVALTDSIERELPEIFGQTFLIDGKGIVISHRIKENLGKNWANIDFINKVISTNDINGNFMYDNEKAIISYSKLDYNGWILVNSTPVDQFYKKSQPIRNKLIWICIIVIAFGFVVANILTFNIYNPLKSIIARFKEKLEGTTMISQNRDMDEYSYINSVVDELSIKVSYLETTLKHNIPLIKHNMVVALVNGNIMTHKELNEYEALLGIRFSKPYLRVVVFKLDDKVLKHMNVENMQFIKYDLIRNFEALSNDQVLFIGVALSNTQIVMLVNQEEEKSSYAVEATRKVVSHAFTNFMVEAHAAISNSEGSVLNIRNCFNKAISFLDYKYFDPEECIFLEDTYLVREQSKDAISQQLIEKLEKAIRSGNIGEVKKAILNITDLLKGEKYSAAYSHQVIRDLMTVISTYYRSTGIVIDSNFKTNFYEELKTIDNIITFEKWLINTISKIYDQIAAKSSNRNREIIERVKKWIEEDLCEDTSLTSIANKVFISSQHLSKIFKEETGMNYLDYVNDKKMEMVRNLLINSNISIEQVTQKLGYSSAAYLIKKFKEKYGVTPGSYKFENSAQNEHYKDE